MADGDYTNERYTARNEDKHGGTCTPSASVPCNRYELRTDSGKCTCSSSGDSGITRTLLVCLYSMQIKRDVPASYVGSGGTYGMTTSPFLAKLDELTMRYDCFTFIFDDYVAESFT